MKPRIYPRYTREQKLSCKLTDKDIAIIRIKRSKGIRVRKLAVEFNVDKTTIYKWTNEHYRQRQLKRSRKYNKDHPRDKIKTNKSTSIFKKRKKLIQPAFKTYQHYKISLTPSYKKNQKNNHARYNRNYRARKKKG